jgi:hypothetical protein
MTQPLVRSLLLCVSLGLPSSSLAALDVSVALRDGRTVPGQADTSTDDTYLRLRIGAPEASVVLGIPWSRVERITAGDEAWSGDDLAAFRQRLRETIADRLWRVRLSDGSERVGAPDRSTNDARLRLRSGDADASIVYGIAWERIREILAPNQTWTPDRFGNLRGELAAHFRSEPERAAQQDDAPREPIPAPIRTIDSSEARDPDAFRRAADDSATSPRPRDDRVRSLAVETVSPYRYAANLNASPAWDGIVLRVRPMDVQGDLVPVQGTVDVTLIGDVGRNQAESIRPIGHWSRVLRSSDYGRDGAIVRLEYQNHHPEPWNAAATDRWHVSQADPGWSIATYGEVSVRMAIPGQGVFAAGGDSPVRLRRFSPLRDRYFLGHGSRVLPQE